MGTVRAQDEPAMITNYSEYADYVKKKPLNRLMWLRGFGVFRRVGMPARRVVSRPAAGPSVRAAYLPLVLP